MRSKRKLKFFKNLSLIIILFLFVVTGGLLVTNHFFGSNNLAAIISNVLVRLTNAQRIDHSLSPLATSTLLTQAAQLKVEDMARRSYFAHLTPDGYNFTYFLDQAGYEYKYAGENLAFDFTESRDVSQAWLASPGHRANLLNDRYTEIGIASATGMLNGKRGIFVAQFFGTPAK